MFFAIANVIIQVFFISICVSSYFTTKTMLTGSLKQFGGVINGIIIGATNYLYRMTAGPLVNLENHKYEEDYNKSYIRKIFWFMFINANVSIIFTIYNDIQQDSDNAIQNLSILIIGMVAQKVATHFMSKIIGRYLIFQAQKWLYFYQCKAASIAQNLIRNRFIDK